MSKAHRIWDVRRWHIGKTVENGSAYVLNAKPSVSELATSGGPDLNSEQAGLRFFINGNNSKPRLSGETLFNA